MKIRDLLEGKNLGLTIFDIDDTLFRTTAQIKVVKNDKVIRSLNNQEFNTYQLKPGESFDFGEFRNAEKFNRESIPIEPMIAKLKAIINNAGDSKVIMLTARSDFDNKELFLDTFRKYGIDMNRVHVHRAGNLGGSPSQNKAVWIRKYLDTGDYARVRLYDDAMSNIKMFINLQQEYPDIKFFPYFVTHAGSIKTIKEGVGRIVKGVNTTVDVGPDEIKRQAAKFGNHVDRDGRPPTMSNAVKGKSTNVLFNLGLTEGIKLRLERDKHIDVLHITDTNNNHRIEVRGKKGYESGGYDSKDKLHQVLDRVGKAANISELMNGEVVHINPGHPQGTKAIRTARDVLQTKESKVLFALSLIESIDSKTKNNYNQFVEYCCDFLELEQKPTIRLTGEIFDETFGYFNSDDDSITVSYYRRHQMDVMRTIAHELTHYRQRLDGEELDGSDGSDHENEANAFAGVMLRQWADKHPYLFSEQKFTDYELALMEGGHSPEPKTKKEPGRLFTELNSYAIESSPRMNPADIAAATRASSTGLSQAELQRLTSQYRSQPPNAIVSLLNSFDADTVISIALAIGAPHLSFLQRFLIRRGIRFSRNLMQQAMAQVEGITEALDQPYPVRWTIKDDDEWEGKAKTEAGDSIQIFITQGHNNHKWEIDFYVGGSMQVTGKGDQFRVFATVVSAIKEWESWLSKSKQPVEAIIFSAFKGNEDTKGSAGRSKLYSRFANQFARSIGFDVSTVDGSDNIKFVLSNPNYKDQQTENFADGKKKGKSRPGRVKKSGASCNGSVTDLRKRAKKYSGERGRMYHWCANMKSGRKKS